MSYSTWSTNGYGVCVENLDFTLERLEELISRTPEFESELKNISMMKKLQPQAYTIILNMMTIIVVELHIFLKE